MQQSSVCKMTDEPKESRVCVANQSQTGKLYTNSSLYFVLAKTENSVCTSIPIFEKLHCLSLLNDESKITSKFNDIQTVKYFNSMIYLHFENLKRKFTISRILGATYFLLRQIINGK